MASTFGGSTPERGRGHATPDAIAWAMDLSESERVAALTTLPRVGWAANEQAKFVAIWIVIGDRRAMELAVSGTLPVIGEPTTDEPPPTDALLGVLALSAEVLGAELETLIARYRADEPFTDDETERLGIMWAALNLREGLGAMTSLHQGDPDR